MTFITVLYCLCALALVVYGANCHLLTYLFKKTIHQNRKRDHAILKNFYGNRDPVAAMSEVAAQLPVVTTQLPIYNEQNVALRLIDAVAAFQYPAGKHEIQVLDDSTDETQQLIARKVAELKSQGVTIKHITRDHRLGFKAGALRNGLKTAKGEFTAIFDADFVPPADFLLRAMPHFQNAHLGFVQARWGHLNSGQSIITLLQSIGIDGHFMIEQSARHGAGLFLNFNGTAGIFRNSAVVEAGNWQGDTLTEDMDLSYRIQLKGWGCRYLVDLIAPAEIPANINAFKNQQFRWAKGSIQTAIKLLPRILRSPCPLFRKAQAVMHLTHYLVHPLMLFLSITALPIILSKTLVLPPIFFMAFGVLLLASCSGPSVLYYTAERSLKRSRLKLILLLPVMVVFGCGLAINNSYAVLEAIFGKKGEFVRTPKQGSHVIQNYVPQKNRLFILELLLGLWCLFGTGAYFFANHYLVGHFLLIYAAGFFLIGLLSWRHA